MQQIQRTFNYSALIIWCSICILPFLMRIHFVPLPQWLSEVLCVVCPLLLAYLILFLCGSLAWALPRSSLWMLLLALVWYAQSLWLPLNFPGMSWSAALAFVSMAILAYITFSLKEKYGIVSITCWLAWALLIGALLQSLIGFLQVADLARYTEGIIWYSQSHPTTDVFGHIGQRNQYAHYLAWGALATGYLFAQRKISGWLAWPIIFWLALSIGWSASRTSLSYSFAMFIVALVWHWRLRTYESRKLLLTLSIVGVLIIALQFLLPLFNHLIHLHAAGSGAQRLVSSGIDSMAGRRSAEWHKAWIVFTANPWFGIGWSQFGAQSMELQMRPEFASAAFNSSLFVNAHNLVLQLLAEMGLIGTLATLGGFVFALYPYFSRPAKPEAVLPLALMCISLFHSMVEYPLWYLYFLAVFVMALSLAPTAEPAPKKYKFGGTIGFIGVIPVIIFAMLSIHGWYIYSNLINLYTPSKNAQYNQKNQARLEKIIKTEPLYAFQALDSLSNYIRIDKNNLAGELYWTERMAAFRPYVDVMINKARLEALSGKPQQAQQTLRMALASYPTYAKYYLGKLPKNEPAYKTLRPIAQAAYDNLPLKYKN